MLIGQKGIKYGLQVRQPKQGAPPPPAKKASVFGDDESDEDQPNVEQQIARQAARKQTDRKVSEMHAAALAEDASVFDYDAHFDSIQETQAEPKRQEKMARQSRYIAGLLEKAEERKHEQDILYERQLAKERAAEDHLFGDKERFVTAAYRKKLEEDAKWKEEQRKIQEEEERNTVEKRGHMGDFYRNLLRNNVAFGTALPAVKEKTGAKAERPEPAGAGGAAPLAGRDVAGNARPQHGAEAELAEGVAGRESAARPAARDDLARASREAQAAPGLRREGGISSVPATVPAGLGEAPAEAVAASAAQPAAERRDKEAAVAEARERYLARKRKAGGADSR